MNAYYSIPDREAVENGNFYGGEPIWNTAEKQGVKTGCFFWVGSEADIQGMYPSYTKRYDHDLPFGQRIDSVIYWLQLPHEKRPQLILWYMHEPDSKGHYFGPENPDLVPVIETLDSLLGVFLDRIETLPIADKINIIVTSDHGMGQTSNDRVVFLDDYIKDEWFETIQGYNPNFNFKAKEEYYDVAYETLSDIDHVSVWKHGEVPARLHYGNNPRTMDFILVADSSWSVGWMKDEGKFDGGAHGYDNDNKDMHAMFFAMGPDFKNNYLQPTFNNVDIYPLIAHIFGLTPASVDGKLENVEGMLVEE
jgi:alkaline phosphatase D